MMRATHRPSVFVCASAVGFYGDRDGRDALDEAAQAGTDFLAQVCASWEAAAAPARDLGVRVVNARIGVVLGPDGGALEEMAKPFRAFAGGPIGSGEQVVSWVSLTDAVNILLRCIDDASLDGPVNVVAPNAVTNAQLSTAIGAVLGRPSWLRVPALALRARVWRGRRSVAHGSASCATSAGGIWLVVWQHARSASRPGGSTSVVMAPFPWKAGVQLIVMGELDGVEKLREMSSDL